MSKAVRKFTAEDQEIDAENLQKEATTAGATTVATCGDRVPVTVLGTIRAMTIRPRAGVPALEAELYDGSGTVTLVWLGRRTIAGLGPGRQVRATGRITNAEGRKLIYNPRYELTAVDN
ncbi:MAG TPA: OB-fold nucleic acid binding domain-containing protein [Mycobacteriales bacterium]|nr:OB-fold nucleic acid binding domain-containing protein [Mycobacteriales bacterium]